mmetsp:Transcript_18878/g.38333  ORF Transcript_18878/g.38333 Transcript_18878/m.38333 type:complete len:217 (-) Transcript_18878:875-1525(-)
MQFGGAAHLASKLLYWSCDEGLACWCGTDRRLRSQSSEAEWTMQNTLVGVIERMRQQDYVCMPGPELIVGLLAGGTDQVQRALVSAGVVLLDSEILSPTAQYRPMLRHHAPQRLFWNGDGDGGAAELDLAAFQGERPPSGGRLWRDERFVANSTAAITLSSSKSPPSPLLQHHQVRYVSWRHSWMQASDGDQFGIFNHLRSRKPAHAAPPHPVPLA